MKKLKLNPKRYGDKYKLTEEEKERIILLWREGLDAKEIAEEVKRSANAVNIIMRPLRREPMHIRMNRHIDKEVLLSYRTKPGCFDERDYRIA